MSSTCAAAPRTMPDYDELAAEGIHTLDGGIRVFAGQRDDPFYIDLGAIFDTLNLRSPGVDMLSGFNVHTIALELPISMVSEGSIGETVLPMICHWMMCAIMNRFRRISAAARHRPVFDLRMPVLL